MRGVIAGRKASGRSAVSTPSLRDRLLDLRNRLVGDPRVREWAIRFPLSRPIARKKAHELFDLCAGFVYSQILLSCVRLRVFDHLADRSMSVGELADATGLSEDAGRRLVEAAVALRLLQWRGKDHVGLGELGAALRTNPGLIAMIEHHAMLYEDLTDPVALLRGDGAPTRLGAYWSYTQGARDALGGTGEVASYSDLMSASQPMISTEVLARYSVGRHRKLLDIGGGDGTFCAAAAVACPNLSVEVFDLPAVADRARSRFDREGFGDRASATGGDFFRDELPRGADLISLVRVLYDHNDESAMRILRAARAAASPGATLLVAEPMAKARGAEAVGDAYFGIYLLAMGQGRPRSGDELCAMIRASGFSDARIVSTRMPLQTGLVVATA